MEAPLLVLLSKKKILILSFLDRFKELDLDPLDRIQAAAIREIAVLDRAAAIKAIVVLDRAEVTKAIVVPDRAEVIREIAVPEVVLDKVVEVTKAIEVLVPVELELALCLLLLQKWNFLNQEVLLLPVRKRDTIKKNLLPIGIFPAQKTQSFFKQKFKKTKVVGVSGISVPKEITVLENVQVGELAKK